MGKLPKINRRPFTSPNAGRSTPQRAERDEVAGGGTPVTRARHLRKNATEAERMLWASLCGLKKHGLHFRRQAPIDRYFADFACHRSKIIVELDGSQHGEEENVLHDEKRTAFLNSRGYQVLRFWNLDVIKNRDGVVEAIVRAAKGPHPSARADARTADLPATGEVKK